nr:ScbR family autoregulator-binding transcription factor [Streptomyces sp. SP2-10]
MRTRRAVLEAAAAVFAERGYAAATITEILGRAGVTKGALYFHFDSKAALARGVLREQLRAEYHLPRDLKLQEWVDAGMTLATRLPQEPLLLAGVRLSADLQGQGVFDSAWPAWGGLTSCVLTEAKRRGEVLPHVVPEETAQVFLGSCVGVRSSLRPWPAGPTWTPACRRCSTTSSPPSRPRPSSSDWTPPRTGAPG